MDAVGTEALLLQPADVEWPTVASTVRRVCRLLNVLHRRGLGRQLHASPRTTVPDRASTDPRSIEGDGRQAPVADRLAPTGETPAADPESRLDERR